MTDRYLPVPPSASPAFPVGNFPAPSGNFPAQPGNFPAQPGNFPAQPGNFPMHGMGAGAQANFHMGAPNNQPPKKNGNVLKILLILLAVFVVLALIAAAVFFFVIPKPNGKPALQDSSVASGLTQAEPKLLKVLDVSVVPSGMTLVPVSDDATVLHSDGMEIVRFTGAEGRLMGVPLADGGPQPWVFKIDDDASVGMVENKVLLHESKTNNDFRVDARTGKLTQPPSGTGRVGYVKPYDLGKTQTHKAAPVGCENERGFAALAAIQVSEGKVCADAGHIWETVAGKQIWMVNQSAEMGQLNLLNAEKPLWFVDGDLLVFADKDGIFALNVKTGKVQWKIADGAKSWCVDNKILYLQSPDGKTVKIYDLSADQSGDKILNSKVPETKPEDSGETQMAKPDVPATAPKTDSAPQLKPSVSPEQLAKERLFKELEGLKLIHASGAGGWGTSLVFGANGTFSGEYRDYDYDATTLQAFEGRFEYVKQKSDTVYVVRIAGVKFLKPVGETMGSEHGRPHKMIVVPTAKEVELGKEYEVYLPGTKASETYKDYVKNWIMLPQVLKSYDVFGKNEYGMACTSDEWSGFFGRRR